MDHSLWFATSSGSVLDDKVGGSLASVSADVVGLSTVANDLLSSISPSLTGMEGDLVSSTSPYIATVTIMSIILLVGITGNALVPIVIAKSKDLRNSTNIFLVNLALADFLVILICLPTGLIELHSTPGVWYLGKSMCKSIIIHH